MGGFILAGHWLAVPHPDPHRDLDPHPQSHSHLIRQYEQHMLVDDAAPIVVERDVAEVGEAGDEQHTLLRPPLRVTQPILRWGG